MAEHEKDAKNSSEKRSSILDAVTDRTKLIALILLIAEGICLLSIKIDQSHFVLVFCVFAAILVIALLSCVWLESKTIPVTQTLGNESTIAEIERMRYLKGTWIGTYNQERGPDGEPIKGSPIEITLRVTEKRITGDACLKGKRRDDSTFELKVDLWGSFLHNRFLQLDYKVEDSCVIAFGGIILEVPNNPKTIKGRYVGLGAFSGEIIHGDIVLEKKPL